MKFTQLVQEYRLYCIVFSDKSSFSENNLVQIWHGDSTIAETTTDADELMPYELQNMFDDDPNTMWHSATNHRNKDKTITIDFVVSKLFISRYKFEQKSFV